MKLSLLQWTAFLLFLIPTIGKALENNPVQPSPMGESQVLPVIDVNNPDEIINNLSLGRHATVLLALQNASDMLTGPQGPNYYFLLGLLAFHEKQFTSAEDFFKKANSESAPAREYLSFWMGKTLKAQDKHNEALNWLTPPVKLVRLIDKDIFWERLDCLTMLKHTEEASLVEAATLLKRFQKSLKSEQEQIQNKFYQARIFLLKGMNNKADPLLRQLLTQYAGNQIEQKIEEEFKKRGGSINTFLSSKDKFKRAKNLVSRGRPEEAIKIYETLSVVESPSLKEDSAYAVYKNRDYQKAALLYQELWDNPPKDANRAFLLSQLASSYGRSDQFEKALIYHQKMVQLYPGSKFALESHYKIAFIYFDSERYQKAFDAFSSLVAKKTKYKSEESQQYRLWSAYLLKNYDFVLKDIESRQKKTKLKDFPVALSYWKARSLEQKGLNSEAQKTYQNIIDKKPLNYYAFLSRQRLTHHALNTKTVVDTPSLHFIPETRNNPFTPSTKSFAQSTSSKAALLGQVGLLKYAYDESQYLADNSLKGLIDMQNFYRLYALGQPRLKNSSLPQDPYYWILAYPLAYASWVDGFSNRYALESNLIWSVMREESAFKPSAISSANALGLMQIIPKTGYEIARDLGKNDFYLDDLADPVVALEFGSHYLSKRLSQFSGNMVYAIASYNAGPDAVERWKKWGDKRELDEFIEMIPYDETREYVKKVLKSYWIYKKLYS